MNPDVIAQVESSVQALKEGDQSRYCEIVEAMLPAVRSFVVSKSLPGMDADEIVQRSFIEAYKNIGEYQAGTDFRAWIVTIARYQTMREATRLRRQADYHTRFVPVAIATQLEKRLAAEQTEDDRLLYLRECLSQLSSSARELLRRRYEDDLSMNDIADALNRTSGAVRKELCVLRKKLQECVERKLALVSESPGGQQL